MAKIKLQGNEINTSGDIPATGSYAPEFTLVKGDLSEAKLSDFKGKNIILNIFPSLDTPTCAMSVRTFNENAASLDNTVVLAISADLPFAQSRFCSAEGIENLTSLSAFRASEFGIDYGLKIIDGPLRGLLARSVIILDEKLQVIYTELVDEISEEPDYKKALEALKQ